MGGTDELPPWVVPSVYSVRDLTFLALRAMGKGWVPEFCAGVVSATAWVHGMAGAPVTADRGSWPDPDVWDPGLVEAESWAAGLAGSPNGGLDMTEVCRVLDVPLRIPLHQGPNYSAGVYISLRWMLGMETKPPMPLPWRRDDTGQLADGAYIFSQLRAEAGRLDEPGEARLRAKAMRLAEDSRQRFREVREHLASLNTPSSGEPAQ